MIGSLQSTAHDVRSGDYVEQQEPVFAQVARAHMAYLNEAAITIEDRLQGFHRRLRGPLQPPPAPLGGHMEAVPGAPKEPSVLAEAGCLEMDLRAEAAALQSRLERVLSIIDGLERFA